MLLEIKTQETMYDSVYMKHAQKGADLQIEKVLAGLGMALTVKGHRNLTRSDENVLK